MKRGDKIVLVTFVLFTIILCLIFVNAVVFEDRTQTDFSGTYVNTSYNGNGIILNGTNLTGTYTSRIFDAGNSARWNNLSSVINLSLIRYLYAVDGQGKVYSSSDSGVSWILKNSGYGRTTDTQDMFSDSSGNLYIMSNSNKEIWKSTNNGISWTNINDTFSNLGLLTGMSDNNGYLYAIAGASAGIVYRSSNQGVSWTQINASYNNGNGAARGLTWNGSALYAVDGQGKVYSSSDSGVSWILKNSSYGRTTDTQDMFSDSSGNLYIMSNSNKEIWKSTNNGISWTNINDTFSNLGLLTGMSDNNGYLYAIAGASAGIVYRSSNGGISWTQVNASYNNGNGAARGMTTLIKNTNLTFQVKNCSLADCSDGIWQTLNLDNINLTGRYFQYKVNFTSQDASITPKLYNVSLDYTVLNIAPSVDIVSPQDGQTYRYNTNIDLNFTVTDTDNNTDSCWYNLDNQDNISLPGCLNKTISIGLGNHVLVVYANDSQSAVGNSNVSFSITNTAPILTIILPQNGNMYGYNKSLPLNYSVNDYDSNLDSCWYNLDNTENISLGKNGNCQNTTFNASDLLSHTIYLYANDSLGYLASVSAFFSINTQIQINLISPSDDAWTNNNNIELNYTVQTAATLHNCSLLINGVLNKTNSTINKTGGTNKFDIHLDDGTYVWNVFCTDSYNSFGNNKTINIDSQVPLLTSNYPLDNALFVQNLSIPLNFSVSDVNLNKCWYSLDNRINYSLNCINGTNNFNFNYSTGNYNLSLYANDSANNLALYRIYNLTIQHDSVAPNLTLNEPTGTKTSLTSIPVQFSSSDNDIVDSCWYNFTSLDGTITKSNTALINCQNSSFDVSVATDYIFYLSVKDRTGNINTLNSSFSISISTPVNNGGSSGNSGSGGGGSGGSSNASKAGLEVSEIGEIIVREGDKKTLSLNAKNIGKIFLNNCKLKVSGEVSSWVYSIEISGIAPGENKNFILDLNIPEGIEEKDYSGMIGINCDEASIEQDLRISMPKGLQYIKIKEIKQDKGNLNVIYTYEGNAGKIDVEIWMLNKDNVEYERIKDSFSAEDSSLVERNAVINIPEDLTGIYSVNLALSSNLNNLVKQSIVLGKSSTTGFAVLDEPGNKLIAYVVFLLIIVGGILFIVFWNKKNKGIKTKIKVKG